MSTSCIYIDIIIYPFVLEVTARDEDYHGALEERDPKYDEMLKQMVGRITSRPGGKLEMGEVRLINFVACFLASS